jgi:hypothetical protein
MQMTIAEKIIAFNSALELKHTLPEGVEIMNPYLETEATLLSRIFYRKYYSDTSERIAVFGINPGRFGAGITGIPFTDPLNLEKICEIESSFKKIPEQSSRFVYDWIETYGGVDSFYAKYFVTSICPLGFVKDGKNYNYYDSKELLAASTPFIIQTLKQQMELGISGELAFCLGKGKNQKFFEEINAKCGFFRKIIPLPHPRWVIQYNRRNYDQHLKHFVKTLKEN